MGDNTKPLRLLSLDGGGIRGYSELIMIEALMKRVQVLLKLPESPLPLPADYFDLIAGTSAGGLIAIMLGRLRMTIEDAKVAYEKLSYNMFAKQQNFKIQEEGRLDDKVFTSVIKDVVQQRLGDPETKLRLPAESEQACKIFVCTVCTSNVPQIRRFRSYWSADSLEHDCAIWEAARATSAAPTYYPAIDIGPPGGRERFIDGGVGCNNPICELHVEAERIFESSREVACVISLGTGKRKVNKMQEPKYLEMFLAPTKFKGVKDIVKSFKRMALDSDAQASRMDRKYQDVDGVYFRFTVEQGLQDVKLAEPNKLSDVKTQTLAYIDEPIISAKLDRAAAALVGQYNKERRYLLGQLSLSNELVIQTTRQQSAVQSSLEERKAFYLRWLSQTIAPVSTLHDYNDNLSKRFVDDKTAFKTCTWVFDNKTFQEYYGSGTSSILWLKGHPGSGKSVIASAVIEYLSTQSLEGGHHPPLYFFCHQDPRQTTLKDIICGIIAQISQWEDQKILDLLEQFHNLLPDLGQGQETTAALLKLLQKLLSMSEKRIFIVLDSVESCATRLPAISPLISAICHLGMASNTSIIFTSRWGLDQTFISPSLIQIRNDPQLQLRQLEITPDDTALDLKAFVTYRVNHSDSALAMITQDQKQEILDTVCDRANGMFLYADLALDSLTPDKTYSKSAIKSTLKELPEGLFRTYERQLQLVASRRKGPEVFWWIYAATRPLEWDELRHGIAIVDGEYNEDELIEQPRELFIQETCGPLVELCGQNKTRLRFIHPTIREMFDEENESREQLRIHLAHPNIATKLLNILNTPKTLVSTKEVEIETPNGQGRGLNGYAMLNWYKHLKSCGQSTDKVLEQALHKFLSSAVSLDWLIATLVTMKSGEGDKSDIYALVEDVTDCLWSWIRNVESNLDGKLIYEAKAWGRDFLMLMLDWRTVLEKQPHYIYSIDFDLLPRDNRFRQFVDSQTQHRQYQSVIRFSDTELQTRSSLTPTWQNDIFAVDENRGFAYVYQHGFLQCYHLNTKLLIAEIPLGDMICEKALLSPDKTYLAILFTSLPVLDEYTASYVSKIRQGLQLSSINASDFLLAFRLENEADDDETQSLSAILAVPQLERKVYLVSLSYQGLSRTNLFGLPPGMSSFNIRTFDTDVTWKVDDPDLLSFSADSTTLATPAGLISLLDGFKEKTKIPLPIKTKYRSTKITEDLQTIVTIRDRKNIEFWNIESRMLLHSAELTGIGHILAISYSGKYVLLFRTQNHKGIGKTTTSASKDKKLKAQRGTLSIYDPNEGFLDLCMLYPPGSKTVDNWAFHLSPVKPRFASEDLPVPKVLVSVPKGWSFTRDVQYAFGVNNRHDLAKSRHLLLFEGDHSSQGFGTNPILKVMVPIPNNNNIAKDSFKFPQLFSWSSDLDTILTIYEGKISRVNLGTIKGWIVGRKKSVYEKEGADAFTQTLASVLFSTLDREMMYRLQFILRSKAEPVPIAEDVSAESKILMISDARVDLEIQSVDQRDIVPVTCRIMDLLNENRYFPPLESSHISISNDGQLTIGSLHFQLTFADGKLEARKTKTEECLFERATKSFASLCHPFRSKASSFFEVFSESPWKSNLAIFQKSHVAFAEFIGKNDDLNNLFTPTVIETCQDHLAIGQYSRLIDPGEIVSEIRREAQCFEIHLTIFDECKGLTWMATTTTAGHIIRSDISVPQIRWALHPTEPLLAWILPGHRIRLSHIMSGRPPLNIAEPFDLDIEVPNSVSFSPNGRYLLAQGEETCCNPFWDSPLVPNQRSITIFDLSQGFKSTLKFSKEPKLSIYIDNDAIRIYRVTREDVVEMYVSQLPYLTSMERFNLTYIPSDCCCPTCGVPFQKDCDVFAQHFKSSVSIVLSHGPVGVGHGPLARKACEPLILRAIKPTTNVEMEEKDNLILDRSTAFIPNILNEDGSLNLDAFDLHNHSSKGIKPLDEHDAFGAEDVDLSAASPLAALLSFFLSMAHTLGSEQQELAQLMTLIEKAVAILRDKAVKQPLLKASNFTLIDSQKTPILRPDEVESFTNKLEKDATSRLQIGPQLEEMCTEMFQVMKKKLGDRLHFDNWSEMSEMMQELEEEDEGYRKFVDETFGAGQVGIGAKVPLLIHTFFFHGAELKDEEQRPNQDFDWTLALDVGWIEEDFSWTFHRIFHNDIVNAPAWYDFSYLKLVNDKVESEVSKRGGFSEMLDASLSSIFGKDDLLGGVQSRGNQKPSSNDQGENDHSNDEPELDFNDLDPTDLLENSKNWQNMFKSLSKDFAGAGHFVELRIKALMRQSWVRDIDD